MYDSISQMEPLLPGRKDLEEKAITLLKVSQRLSGSLHPITQRRIARMLRVMNSYYTNLIEGNFTHPADLERAQKGDYILEPRKRALQLEGAAHITVQAEAEKAIRQDTSINIVSTSYIRKLHFEFYKELPQEFRVVRSRDGREITLEPGELRQTDVEVGEHIPPSWESVPLFLKRIEEAYDPSRRNSVEKILAAAAMHHRLAWVHPFLDGNGRVVRLLTHLYFMRAEVDSNGLWSLARGLARKKEEYYEALASADRHRDTDYDGRGNLSQRGLNDFVEFILDVSIDQVQFMSSMLEVDTLLDRLSEYATLLSIREGIDESARHLLTEACLRGEVPRADVSRITGLPDRTSRRLTRSLLDRGILTSTSKMAPLQLDFPVSSVAIIFPALYPQGA